MVFSASSNGMRGWASDRVRRLATLSTPTVAAAEQKDDPDQQHHDLHG
ncbi:hypothetical protein N1027_11535 [Herbiconiux sp. CPCC 205763]|uniref:Uncharacterized protein n=1 Tax=Herbiconiux aconitum TaxID=2970913 RepID=A0ABT2GRB0_9MICO|nr:hypothetical protein [Herbiconiux aconitum]MCS5718765.1 hypothetical protein [Herbiconiux aconitum]